MFEILKILKIHTTTIGQNVTKNCALVIRKLSITFPGQNGLRYNYIIPSVIMMNQGSHSFRWGIIIIIVLQSDEDWCSWFTYVKRLSLQSGLSTWTSFYDAYVDLNYPGFEIISVSSNLSANMREPLKVVV